MTHQEVLERAIQKALDNGWSPEWTDFDGAKSLLKLGAWKLVKDDDTSSWFITGTSGGDGWVVSYSPKFEDVIFNHGFAKALWGDHCYRCIEADQDLIDHFHDEAWKYQLQNMVIEADPIEYLEQNLPE